MKLSKLYSNIPDIFEPVEFVPGLNVVVTENCLPDNKKIFPHNLGRTSLGFLVDFCFLLRQDPEFFLFKHFDLFEDCIFFLEIELPDSSFVTVRRSVKEATKISFIHHDQGHQDFSELTVSEWDHPNFSFERAREFLDGLLDWQTFKPSLYHKIFGYILRSPEDYSDVFSPKQLSIAPAARNEFLARILGFNASQIANSYKIEDELEKKINEEKIIKRNLGGSLMEIGKIDGLLHIKQNDVDKKQAILDAIDFRDHDKEVTKKIVDDIDGQISLLNSRRYSLSNIKKKLHSLLHEDQILFDPDEAQSFFAEVGVLFNGQIKKDFQQLIAFNRELTEGRRRFLPVELQRLEKELLMINTELDDLVKKRSQRVSFLGELDIFNKFKHLSNELVALRADIVLLKKQRQHFHCLQNLRTEIWALTRDYNHLQAQIETNVVNHISDRQSLFSTIRLFFNEIVEEVIYRKALLNVFFNKKGHLVFKAEILDDSGNSARSDLSHSYRKLLCAAFDLSVLRAHLSVRFPRFVYLDGVLESFDDSKKENLLNVLQRYADLGLQPVITLANSDLPFCSLANSGLMPG
jgi:uncharacterized protein YydD (DUF2326 family)